MIALVGLMALTVVVYLPLRDAGFVWEDVPPSAGDWRLLTLTPRALTAATMVWQAAQSVRVLHLTNLAIHLLNGLLLFALLTGVAAGWRFFLTGLWWLHPLHTESVSYLAARADLLLVTAVLLLLLATHLPKGLRELGMLACLWLAFLAKETGAVAVGLLALWLYWRDSRLPWRVLAVGVIAALMVSAHFLSHLGSWTATAPPLGRFIGVQIAAIWRVFALLIVPVGLTPAHQWASMPPWMTVVAVLGAIVVLMGAFAVRQRVPAIAFALAWIVIALAPRVLVPVPHPLTEHQFALPMLGLWLMPTIGR